MLGFSEWELVASREYLQIEFNPRGFENCYTYIEWQRLYQKYVDIAYFVSTFDAERERISAYCRLFKRYQLLVNLVSMFFFPKKDRNLRRRKFRRRLLLASYYRNGLIDVTSTYMSNL